MRRHVSLLVDRIDLHAKTNASQSDFELPHVPHLTTVTNAIVPTARLTDWRNQHPERYSIRLSDHAIPSLEAPTYKGCVRSRRHWMIDHTMYTSSRNGGTRVYRCMNAKEFHEMQWASDDERRGRLVEHRSLELPPLCLSDETLSPLSEENEAEQYSQRQSTVTKRTDSIIQIVRKMSIRARPHKNVIEETQLSTELALPLLATQGGTKSTSAYDLPIESETKIPNAAFARKHEIYEEARAIPPYIRELPIAEAKLASKVKKDAAKEARQSWAHKGPLTPQLWYDSGLDYRWSRR